MIGKTLGHYHIIEKLGAGGMGVVYKARDTHLDRFVAIKVLPAEKVADPDRKRRFIQEAKAASALNHSNIITIHDIDQADGTDFIAMEYVDGKTLDQLVQRKGLRLSETLKYAVPIADALARAHAAGIVHRDLKPSNIMIDAHGQVKVLDFGLAKLTETAPPGEDASTRTVEGTTEKGAIVGTAAYMSPEQAEGKQVDVRSDIFSFGSVLYEMVTGRRPFEGNSKVSTLAAVIERDPAPLGGGAPHDLEKIISRALRKDPERRFQHMDDIKIALEELKEESDSGGLKSGIVPVAGARLRWRTYLSVAALLTFFAAGVLYYSRREPKQEAPLKVIPVTSYPGVQQHPSLSPDGREVAFSWNGEKQDNFDVYVQMVSGGPPQGLTKDPAADLCPQWSPDGNQIAFIRSGIVYLISPRGGQERRLHRSNTLGESVEIAWSPDGKLLYYTRTWVDTPGVWSVPVEGGEESQTIEGARSSHWGVAGKGIYFVDYGAVPEEAPKPLKLFSFETRTITEVGTIEKIRFTPYCSLSVSHDGRWAIWRQLDRNESNIMLIDNFR